MDFWHTNSTTSTLTSRPAKLRQADKPKIQYNLEYHDAVITIMQRRKPFYQSNWMKHSMTVHELHRMYSMTYENPISMGLFLALKPFYVKSSTKKDIEMCVCKTHLHARWCIESIIDCADEQSLGLGEKIMTFFPYLTERCDTCDTTYISWVCSPDYKTICTHIQEQWKNFQCIISKANENVKVTLNRFVKVEIITKNGKRVKQLQASSTKENMSSLVNFFTKMMPKINHHRNQLRHYRNVINRFRDHFGAISIDLDFSENLKVSVKYEPQSLHWSHEQITVHSGILKVDGVKSYHPYLSHDRNHDQKLCEVK